MLLGGEQSIIIKVFLFFNNFYIILYLPFPFSRVFFMKRRYFIISALPVCVMSIDRFLQQKSKSQESQSLLEVWTEKHYAAEVLSKSRTNPVINPKYALGEPDDKYAKIPENGKLILKMQKPFYATRTSNNGVIIAKPGSEYRVAMKVATEENEQGVQYAWRRVPYTTSNVEGGLQITTDVPVDTILITNTGKKPVEIDAVVAGGAAD